MNIFKSLFSKTRKNKLRTIKVNVPFKQKQASKSRSRSSSRKQKPSRQRVSPTRKRSIKRKNLKA